MSSECDETVDPNVPPVQKCVFKVVPKILAKKVLPGVSNGGTK